MTMLLLSWRLLLSHELSVDDCLTFSSAALLLRPIPLLQYSRSIAMAGVLASPCS